MIKNKLLKTFVVINILALCIYFLFVGIILAKSNTEMKLKGINHETIDETEVIELVSKEFTKIISHFK